MKTLPIVLGGLVVVGLIAAASKAKASASSSSTSSSSSTPAPAAGSSTKPPTTVGVPPIVAPNIAAQVIAQVLAANDREAARNQAVWLRDNGYPKTADALLGWVDGTITAAQLTTIATGELATKPSATTSTNPAGTTQSDTYGNWLLANGTNDEIYTYALTARSIPFVAAAAAKLAVAGDLRAQTLNEHLATISGKLAQPARAGSR